MRLLWARGGPPRCEEASGAAGTLVSFLQRKTLLSLTTFPHARIRGRSRTSHPLWPAVLWRGLLMAMLALGWGRHALGQERLRLSGVVTDEQHHPLPFASVYLKGATAGTSTNAAGRYFLLLPPGEHVIVCRYLGYEKQERSVVLSGADDTLDFVMRSTSIHISEVVVRGGEDPANAIIRRAIARRPYYEEQVKAYTCQAYIKGVLHLQNGPDKFLGQDMDYSMEDMDSSHSGIVYLSESLSRLYFKAPQQLYQEVTSSRQSGGGMGFDFPVILDFYRKNVTLLARRFAPRGYISPIADRAMHYYRYRLAGSFSEDGQTVYRIEVQPRRKHEPLFSGYLNIMDSSWRIHSLDLLVTRDYELEIIDSLRIRQIHAAVNDSAWRLRHQTLDCRFDQLGFRVDGAFVSVYSDYDLAPVFPEGLFDSKIIMRYDSLANSRSRGYWDSVRPVPLDSKEVENFRVKDSLSGAYRDSVRSRHFIDSLRRTQKAPTARALFWDGYRLRQYREKGMEINWAPLLRRVSYNTVEGLVTRLELQFRSRRPSGASWEIVPQLRYGWNNGHLNAFAEGSYSPRKEFGMRWEAGGGQRVSQFNHDEPINGLANTIQTLFWKENYMKLYQNRFLTAGAGRRYINGFQWHASLRYEDRFPLRNTSDFSILRFRDKAWLPNHPYELAEIPFERHQALIASLDLSYQPGQRYIQYPAGKLPVGSEAPVIALGYTKGLPDWLGSDVDYDKWYASLQDDIKLLLFGTLKYKLQVGGFLRSKAYSLPDLQHFNGNKTLFNIKYLNSFQLASYYAYSNHAPLYGTLHLEYHLNGLLTNKVPLFNRLHWNLVLGSNAFYVNDDLNYLEGFAGLENIFKVLRVDLVAGYQSGAPTAVGVRIGLGGILGNILPFRP